MDASHIFRAGQRNLLKSQQNHLLELAAVLQQHTPSLLLAAAQSVVVKDKNTMGLPTFPLLSTSFDSGAIRDAAVSLDLQRCQEALVAIAILIATSSQSSSVQQKLTAINIAAASTSKSLSDRNDFEASFLSIHGHSPANLSLAVPTGAGESSANHSAAASPGSECNPLNQSLVSMVTLTSAPPLSSDDAIVSNSVTLQPHLFPCSQSHQPTRISVLGKAAGPPKVITSPATNSTAHVLRHNGSFMSFQTEMLHIPATVQTARTNLIEDDDDDIVQINDYTVIDEAGRGQFGVVKIAIKEAPDETVYAIKIVAKKKVRSHRKSIVPKCEHSQTSLFSLMAQEEKLEQPPKDRTPITAPTMAPLTAKSAALARDRPQLLPQVAGTNPAPLPRSPLSQSRTSPASVSLLDETRREIHVMMALRHRNIVNLLEVIDDPDDGNLYLVMPYCDRGPIVKLSPQGTCTALDVDLARGYMRQITAGLAYLHSQHVAHMDIKPDNILLDSSHRCYLSDFGTSDFFTGGSDMSRGMRGTPAFASPEAIASTTAFNPFHADIWALGVTLYVMLFGRQPFKGNTLAELTASICSDAVTYGDLPDGAEAGDYDDAIDLLVLMLDRNALARPAAAALRSHPFLSPSRGVRSSKSVDRMRQAVSPSAPLLPVPPPTQPSADANRGPGIAPFAREQHDGSPSPQRLHAPSDNDGPMRLSSTGAPPPVGTADARNP